MVIVQVKGQLSCLSFSSFYLIIKKNVKRRKKIWLPIKNMSIKMCIFGSDAACTEALRGSWRKVKSDLNCFHSCIHDLRMIFLTFYFCFCFPWKHDKKIWGNVLFFCLFFSKTFSEEICFSHVKPNGKKNIFRKIPLFSYEKLREFIYLFRSFVSCCLCETEFFF